MNEKTIEELEKELAVLEEDVAFWRNRIQEEEREIAKTRALLMGKVDQSDKVFYELRKRKHDLTK